MRIYQEQASNSEEMENVKTNQQRFCTSCNRLLPAKRTKDICTACEDKELYFKIREYMRSRSANERDLARAFDVPLTQIRRLVQNGCIRYAGVGKPGAHNYCERCGEPVNLGVYCTECMRFMHHENNKYNML